MMTTSTLLIGYYHDLLLKSIDADLLTDKMCSVGLLTAHQQLVISSGHSVHQRNWLLLEHVRHMDIQVLWTFCEIVQQIWQDVGSQLITGLVLFVYNDLRIHSYRPTSKKGVLLGMYLGRYRDIELDSCIF